MITKFAGYGKGLAVGGLLGATGGWAMERLLAHRKARIAEGKLKELDSEAKEAYRNYFNNRFIKRSPEDTWDGYIEKFKKFERDAGKQKGLIAYSKQNNPLDITPINIFKDFNNHVDETNEKYKDYIGRASFENSESWVLGRPREKYMAGGALLGALAAGTGLAVKNPQAARKFFKKSITGLGGLIKHF